MVRAALLALFVVPSAAYVVSSGKVQRATHQVSADIASQPMPQLDMEAEEVAASECSGFAAMAASVGLGAVAGWLSRRENQASAAAAAAVLAATPLAASAMVDYEGVEFLGGSDKVDINNANVQAYRQFPGFYPTAAGKIATHGPYKTVKDIYDIPDLAEPTKAIFAKYEKNLVCLPVSQAYFIDRINNGMYK